VEEIGRTRPMVVAELMKEANKFTDREDAYNNKRDVHQKSTEQVDRGDDTAAGITKEGEIR
jgi:hypothetical protein